MEKVFIDIGGHDGASVCAALCYAFDRIVTIEPDADMIKTIETRFPLEIATGRVEIAPYGLSDRCGEAILFGDNTLGGASVVAGKFAHTEHARTITLIDWSAFAVRYRLANALLWIKINAEGAEIEIIRSMIAGGAQPVALVVYFDIVKSPFGAWRKWAAIRAMRRAGVPFSLAEDVLVKRGPRPRLHNWFSSFPGLLDSPIAPSRAPASKLIRMHYLDIVSALGIRLSLFKRRT